MHSPMPSTNVRSLPPHRAPHPKTLVSPGFPHPVRHPEPSVELVESGSVARGLSRAGTMISRIRRAVRGAYAEAPPSFHEAVVCFTTIAITTFFLTLVLAH